MKKILVSILAGMMVINNSMVALASYHGIGTKQSLGSPILNSEFGEDNWNEWEMLVWGIYLSNFTIPLIDDYESAFDSQSNRGSKGAGYKALVFASGEAKDNGNIDNMLKYAIDSQRNSGLKEIYVSFERAKREGNKVISSVKDGDTEQQYGETMKRKASFRDMFIGSKKKDGGGWVQIDDTVGLISPFNTSIPIESNSVKQSVDKDREESYSNIATINDGQLPKLYIKYAGGYELVWDYTNAWDAQIMTAWLARQASSDTGDLFKDTYNSMYKDNKLNLFLDNFGNIVTVYGGSRRIVVPASVNQHLTNTPKINLINSFMFNGIGASASSNEMALIGQQSVSGIFGTDWGADVRFGGLPAFGSHLTGIEEGSILMYYDTDEIAYDNYFTGRVGNGTKSPIGETVPGEKYKIHYGKALEQLFMLEANRERNNYALKLEVANMDKFDFSGISGDAGDALETMIKASGMLANMYGKSNTAEVAYSIITPSGDVNIFGDPVIIPVQLDSGLDNYSITNAGVGRLFLNHMYNIYNSKIVDTTGVGRVDIERILRDEESSSMRGVREGLLGESVGKVLASFVVGMPDLFNNDNNESMIGKSLNSEEPFKSLGKYVGLSYSTESNLDYFPGRVIKAYPISQIMKALGNVLGAREGTEFSIYSRYIYMTYLDWYGVLDGKEEFNTRIFDGNSDILKVDIVEVVDIKSSQDKKEAIIDMNYLMLHPTEGKEYRDELRKENQSSFLYNQYNKIVYGNASKGRVDSKGNISSRSSGFLNMKSYDDNFMTSWLIKVYSRVVIVVIGIGFMAVIVIGVLKRNKISWFVISMMVIVNSAMLIPMIGDLAPMVANKVSSKIFRDKADMWNISEMVANSKREEEYSKAVGKGNTGGLSEEDSRKVLELSKNMGSLFLDREISIKLGISRKVTETSGGNFEKIQRMRTTRWLIPLIMKQFKGDEEEKNYVYVPLGDSYDSMSSLYFKYNPEEGNQNSIMKASNTEKFKCLSESMKKGAFQGYAKDGANGFGKYRNSVYFRGVEIEDITHRGFFMLEGVRVPKREFGEEYRVKAINECNEEKWKEQAQILSMGGRYRRMDMESIDKSFGFLWNTESNLNYMYQTVKDSFDKSINLAKLANSFLGSVEGEEEDRIRVSFMHEKGLSRDVLDLEYMFKNMIPYMYNTQICAEAVLGEAKIDSYELYKNNKKSWLFRSNWVTKIIENEDVNRECSIGLSDGSREVVKDPLMWREYKGRRMVFSEAQMEADGLNPSDLSILELKCVRINKDTVDAWTSLVNYSYIKGMTKEIMFRQAATKASMIFNEEFSRFSLNDNGQIYPNSFDLRAISFDSIMRQMILNVSRDTKYIQGNTMKNLVEDLDVLSATVLLVAAFLGAYLVPMMRDIIGGLLMYLGMIGILRALLKGRDRQVKIAGGFAVSQLLFVGITILYYNSIALLINMTTSGEEIIKIAKAQVTIGNPVTCILIFTVITLAYMYFMVKIVVLCFKHSSDMGMSVYMSKINVIKEGIDRVVESSMGKHSGQVGYFGNSQGVDESREGRSKMESEDIRYKYKGDGGGTSKSRKRNTPGGDSEGEEEVKEEAVNNINSQIQKGAAEYWKEKEKKERAKE